MELIKMEHFPQFWVDYVSFISVTQAAGVSKPVSEAIPNFWWQGILWTFIFAISSNIVVALIGNWYPNWFKKLDENPKTKEKKDQLDVYIAAYTHHFIAVPIALYLIYYDVKRTPAERASYDYSSAHAYTMMISFGYLSSDLFLYAVPRKDYTYMLHHILGMGLGVACYYLMPGYTIRYLPHIVISELSAIPFLTNWFMKLIPTYEKGIKFLEYLFAIVFFLVRIVHLPVVMYNCYYTTARGSGTNEIANNIILGTVVLIILMQVFWMFAIIKSFFIRSGGKKKGKEGKEEVSVKDDNKDKVN